mgnify:CR=1 FL=1
MPFGGYTNLENSKESFHRKTASRAGSAIKTEWNGVRPALLLFYSLSRLKSATNPESGLIQYAYDNNSNLTQKTDARNVVTNYIYDALNRVTQRNYTAPGGLTNYQATPNVSYFYDNLPNAKGRLIRLARRFLQPNTRPLTS